MGFELDLYQPKEFCMLFWLALCTLLIVDSCLFGPHAQAQQWHLLQQTRDMTLGTTQHAASMSRPNLYAC